MNRLEGNLPLSRQALHKVEQFEDGEWADVLLGALHKLREEAA